MNLPKSLSDDPRSTVRNDRIRDPEGRCVVYWMQRAQRASDNPAMDAAIRVANDLGLPLAVHLGPVPFYPNANERHYAFLLDGVRDIADGVKARGAAFCFRPWPRHSLPAFCLEVRAALVVGDENPLREPERWRTVAAQRLSVPLVTVDADAIVPMSFLAREEYGARTIRPRIHRLLDRFLVREGEPVCHVRWPMGTEPDSVPIDGPCLLREWPLDRSAGPVKGWGGGTAAGMRALADFVERRLKSYTDRRNRPEHADGTSRLSPYLHFGHLGPRSVALAIRDSDAAVESRDAFLEQMVVRRELALNFCARNPDHDRWAGLPGWGRATLLAHASDPRPYVYDEGRLEAGDTHDPLWNAAQIEMVRTGWMHNYARMYWAKKILEWSPHPEQAFEIAVRQNDRWELDGRDPNGYTGIAWAIGGRHDRPWGPERPIFGLVRFMSFASTSRKFDWKAYAARVGDSMET
jgi:deoxyribodipyrimidine photo-lyase